MSYLATAVGQRRVRVPASASGPALAVNVLGGFEMTHDGVLDSVPVSSQRVVAFLALQPRPLQRVYVAGVLWPDSTEEHASACLRSALWRLRRPDYRIVDATTTHLRLEPSAVVDLVIAAAGARRILSGAQSCDERDLDCIANAGDVLPDQYEDWALIERERFRQLRMHALEALSVALVKAGRFAGAVRAGLAAVEGEPLRESAQRALISAHLAEGNPSEALRQYRFFERLLKKELGLAPSEAIRSLLPAGLV